MTEDILLLHLQGSLGYYEGTKALNISEIHGNFFHVYRFPGQSQCTVWAIFSLRQCYKQLIYSLATMGTASYAWKMVYQILWAQAGGF